MDALEILLESLPDGAMVDSHIAREANHRKRTTVDEAVAALEAL